MFWAVGGLEFVSALVGSLAWPFAVVVCVVVLREPLTGLLHRVETVELPGSKATFAATLVQVEEKVAALRSSAPADRDGADMPAKHDVVTEWAVLSERAASQPRQAVLDAWTLFEFQLNQLSDKLDPRLPHGWPQIVRNLEAWEHWQEFRPAVVELRHLRDTAAHSARSPSTEAAERYVIAVQDLVMALQRQSVVLGAPHEALPAKPTSGSD